MLAPSHEDLINAPYADARERLRGSELCVRVLAPAHACAGVGGLRVVRATEQSDGFELVLTYADYIRL